MVIKLSLFKIFYPCTSLRLLNSHICSLQRVAFSCLESPEDQCLNKLRYQTAKLLEQHEPSSFCVPSVLMMMNYSKPTDLKYHPSWMHHSSSWATGRVVAGLPTESVLSHGVVFVCLVFWSTWTHTGMFTSWRSAHPLKTYKVYKVINLSRCWHINPLAIPVSLTAYLDHN